MMDGVQAQLYFKQVSRMYERMKEEETAMHSRHRPFFFVSFTLMPTVVTPIKHRADNSIFPHLLIVISANLLTQVL